MTRNTTLHFILTQAQKNLIIFGKSSGYVTPRAVGLNRIKKEQYKVTQQPCGLSASSKGTLIPLQAWMGPEGSRRPRLPDFKTIST
jgi:hypothetical protein